MAIYSSNNISIKGISATVPKSVEYNSEYNFLSENERKLLIKTIGVSERRKAPTSITTSDLCFASANSLLHAIDWQPEEVDILIFVSQSRDYILPNSAIVLQDRLKLKKSAIAFDVPLGCSGYVYGLSIITSLMQTAKIKKGLLLCGDTTALTVSEKDRTTYPLFGDAGSATALELDETNDQKLIFNLGSDGKNHSAIIIPGGACRDPFANSFFENHQNLKNTDRKPTDLFLNGMEVFSFSVNEVPKNIAETMLYAGSAIDSVDYLLLHQANYLMNETIRKKIGFSATQTPYSIHKFGNTSSASIPLTIVTEINEIVKSGKHQLLMSGFGVGLSWGSLLCNTENLIIPPLIEIE